MCLKLGRIITPMREGALEDMYTVSFFGHRYMENPLPVEKKLEKIIGSLLHQKKYVEFLVGRNGDSDLLTSSVIHRCQREIRSDNSSHTWVLPYMTSELSNHADDFYNYYNEIEICEVAAEHHYKAAITSRNHRMIDRSDLAVFYVTHHTGGAYRTMCYAKRMGVPTINLYDLDE